MTQPQVPGPPPLASSAEPPATSIRDQGYRRYGGGRAPRGQAWLVIARSGIREMLSKRTFLGLVLLAWLPFFVRAVQIYAAATFPQAATVLKVSADTFRQFLGQQETFVFFITVYVGAGLIANDRRANALQIYLSKPLTRAEYVFGKLAILSAFLLLVTWVPAIVLLIVQIAFAGNFTFFTTNLFLFPAITVFAGVQVALGATTMLALSSLSNSSRYVGILYAVVLFFTQAIYGVLYIATRSSAFSWVSLSANLAQVGDVIFRLTPEYDTPWPVSFVVIVIVIAVSGIVLERRVRGVEVVA
jgi:ABC-2 type transport system permease protein